MIKKSTLFAILFGMLCSCISLFLQNLYNQDEEISIPEAELIVHKFIGDNHYDVAVTPEDIWIVWQFERKDFIPTQEIVIFTDTKMRVYEYNNSKVIVSPYSGNILTLDEMKYFSDVEEYGYTEYENWIMNEGFNELANYD